MRGDTLAAGAARDGFRGVRRGALLLLRGMCRDGVHRHVLEALVLVLGLVPLEHLYHSLWVLLLLRLADVRVLQHQVPVLGHAGELARRRVEADVQRVLEVGRRRDDRLLVVVVAMTGLTTIESGSTRSSYAVF